MFFVMLLQQTFRADEQLIFQTGREMLDVLQAAGSTALLLQTHFKSSLFLLNQFHGKFILL